MFGACDREARRILGAGKPMGSGPRGVAPRRSRPRNRIARGDLRALTRRARPTAPPDWFRI